MCGVSKQAHRSELGPAPQSRRCDGCAECEKVVGEGRLPDCLVEYDGWVGDEHSDRLREASGLDGGHEFAGYWLI